MPERVVQERNLAGTPRRGSGLAGRPSHGTTLELADPKAELARTRASRCWLPRRPQKFLPPNPGSAQKRARSTARRVVVFAAPNLWFIDRFRLPTTTRYPPMWLFSSAMQVCLSVARLGKQHEQDGTRQGARDRHPGHNLDVTVEALPRIASSRIPAVLAERSEFLLSVENKPHS
jgi:hypothetical protein